MASTSKNVQSKYDRIIAGLDVWTAFYRANPHRFGLDYFGMKWMRPFQQILIVIILKFTYTMIIASRGMGKSQIVAAAIVIKCTLYPKTKVVISAGKRNQSTNVIEKIVNEFVPTSRNLQSELESWSTAPSGAYIKWKNGSIVKIATASDSARSARANWVINDEFVQIKKSIIDTVLRKFKAGQRTPNFYNKPEYKNHPKEPNCETYISSAYYKWHYSWEKFKAFFKSMLRGDSYCVLGFPYQLPVSEGYYPIEQVQEEMMEDDWDAVAWSIEMESLFFGEANNAFYSFQDITINRIIDYPIYPKPYYAKISDAKIKYQNKVAGEIRIGAMDIATQGGAKNDNTCFAIVQLLPTTNNQFMRNLIYMETLNGGHTFDQAIRMRQLYDDFDLDYVVVDTNGVGIGVADNLFKDIIDEERFVTYPAWSCINDPSMAERCKTLDAPKIVYSIKATAKFNSDIAVHLRDCMKRNKFRLLINEIDANEKLGAIKSYALLSPEEQLLFQAPYYQTSAFINETINLTYEIVNGNVKVSEQAGMRKDRYSAVAYANYIASELERNVLSKKRNTDVLALQMRKPMLYKR